MKILIKKYLILAFLLFQTFDFESVFANKINETPAFDERGINESIFRWLLSADKGEWEITEKNCGDVSHRKWYYWHSTIGKSRYLPIEFEFIKVATSWDKWHLERRGGSHSEMHPEAYLNYFFKIYSERESNVLREVFYLQSGFSDNYKYFEEGKNYYVRRCAVLSQRPCGICEISIFWEDFIAEVGHIPNTYILITRFNIPLQEIDKDLMNSLCGQVRALVIPIK